MTYIVEQCQWLIFRCKAVKSDTLLWVSTVWCVGMWVDTSQSRFWTYSFKHFHKQHVKNTHRHLGFDFSTIAQSIDRGYEAFCVTRCSSRFVDVLLLWPEVFVFFLCYTRFRATPAPIQTGPRRLSVISPLRQIATPNRHCRQSFHHSPLPFRHCHFATPWLFTATSYSFPPDV